MFRPLRTLVLRATALCCWGRGRPAESPGPSPVVRSRSSTLFRSCAISETRDRWAMAHLRIVLLWGREAVIARVAAPFLGPVAEVDVAPETESERETVESADACTAVDVLCAQCRCCRPTRTPNPACRPHNQLSLRGNHGNFVACRHGVVSRQGYGLGTRPA